MISNKQKKLLKRVTLYSDLVIYEMLGLLATAFLMLILFMIDDLVLNNPGFFESGVHILLIVFVLYCPLMLFHGIYARQVTVKKDWRDMEGKAKELLAETEENEETEHGSTVAKAATLVGLAATKSVVKAARIGAMPAFYSEMKRTTKRDDAMMDLFGVKLRFRNAAKLALVLPLVALLVAFGIRCVDASQTKESAYTAAGSAVDALVDSFSEGCVTITGDDPDEYDENGYQWTCVLDDNWDNYVRVEIDNSGLISEVWYTTSVDVNATKEDNLTLSEDLLSQMYALIVNSGVEAQGSQLEEPTLTDTFKESFLAGSYYERISESTDTFTLIYATSDQEDYETGDSYFLLLME